LARKAREIKKAINKVEGLRHYYWKTEGLPQMTVRYDRSKIARYGLNIAELNDMIARFAL
jgi:cobalt-zinc-cadmium resistance protein CzcA